MDTLHQKLNFFSEPAFREALMEYGKLVTLKKGDVVVKEGQYVKFLPIVLSGSIRVYQQKEEREILLYYVRAQETCTMSLAAAYFNNKSSSHGIAVEDTELLIIPADRIPVWQREFLSWNRYVVQMFRSRYDELINSFQKMAFDHIPDRVWEYLTHTVTQTGNRVIAISHQQLAHELGTTRVVISRILKQLEKEKKLRLSRGAIHLS